MTKFTEMKNFENWSKLQKRLCSIYIYIGGNMSLVHYLLSLVQVYWYVLYAIV